MPRQGPRFTLDEMDDELMKMLKAPSGANTGQLLQNLRSAAGISVPQNKGIVAPRATMRPRIPRLPRT